MCLEVCWCQWYCRMQEWHPYSECKLFFRLPLYAKSSVLEHSFLHRVVFIACSEMGRKGKDFLKIT